MFATRPTSLAFIDSNLPDINTLVAGLPAHVEYHVLHPQLPALQQMVALCADRVGLAALHLICHGAPGELHLGNDIIDLTTLKASHPLLYALSDAMAEEGEILLYGCEVAAGVAGRQFVDTLRSITGLKIAAATHKVGHADLGGSWDLDVNTAALSAVQPLAVQAWRGVLQPAAETPPVITLNAARDTITLTFSKPLNPDQLFVADANLFQVYVGDGDLATLATISPVSIIDGKLVLKLNEAIGETSRIQSIKYDLLLGDAESKNLKFADNIWVGDFTATPPTIVGIGPDDNSTTPTNSLANLDSFGTNSYAYVIGVAQNSYLTISQPTGTKDGAFAFEALETDPNIGGVSSLDDYTITSQALIAKGGSDFRVKGNIKEGDTICLLTWNGASIDVTEIGTVDSLLTATTPLKITFTRTTDNVSGIDSNIPGDMGWVLQLLKYSAPTGGAREFSIAVNNDETTVSQSSTVVLTVEGGSKTITYSATSFAEAAANDGSITASITLTLAGDTYKGTNGEALAGATVTNVPDGLTAAVTKTSDTVATVTFTGKATTHANDNDIANLTITLGDSAFTGNDASVVTNANKSDLAIDFEDSAAPVINGIDADDSSSFAVRSYIYIDSESGTNLAYITDADSKNLNGGYLSIAYTSGTEDGTFRFSPDVFDAKNNVPTGNVAVLASSDGGTTLKTDGSFAAGDSVVVIKAGDPVIKEIVGTVDATANGQAGHPLKINFTTNDATTGDKETGAVGFVLQFLQYTAPTGGAREFAITANDGENTSV